MSGWNDSLLIQILARRSKRSRLLKVTKFTRRSLEKKPGLLIVLQSSRFAFFSPFLQPKRKQIRPGAKFLFIFLESFADRRDDDDGELNIVFRLLYVVKDR